MAIRLEHITVDCAEPRRLADWWAAALHGQVTDDWGDYVIVAARDAGIGMLGFQVVPEAKAVKNRVHLDFHVPDRGAEVARLVDLGATEVAGRSAGPATWVAAAPQAPPTLQAKRALRLRKLRLRTSADPLRWTIMLGPDGNEFCVGQQDTQ